MNATEFLALALACAPGVHPATVHAVVQTESDFNPWALGVTGGALRRQPASRAEALATARHLRANGWDFSAGLGQINVRNWARLGLTLDTVFEPCANLAALQTLLTDCFERAQAAGRTAAPVPTNPTRPRSAPRAAPKAAPQAVMGAVLQASTQAPMQAPAQVRLQRALSCYYSGNFLTGFEHGYVRRVTRAAQRPYPRDHLDPLDRLDHPFPKETP